LLPGSLPGGNLPAYDERIPITGRGKGKAGVYAAYLTGSAYPRVVSLLTIGTKTPVKVGSVSTGFIDGDAVTAALNGRLWVTWWYGGTELYTRVSGTTGTTFGKTVRIPVPSGTTTIWKVYSSAQNGRLDVLALLTRDGKIAYYATQVLLPAPLKAKALAPAQLSLAQSGPAGRYHCVSTSAPPGDSQAC
jgi:hypothetical protein